MNLTFNKSQRFTVPEQMTAILNGELAKIDNAEPGINGITFNFRDDDDLGMNTFRGESS